MSRDFSSSNYLSYSGAVASAVPFSVACWFMVTTASPNFDRLLSIGDQTDNEEFTININTLFGVGATSRTGGSGATATSSANTSQNTWAHAAGVFTSSSSRAAFLDGANKGTNSTSSTPSGLDLTVIGARANATQGSPFRGHIAEVGLWDVALTDAEVAILGAGYSPLLVRPQSLVAYWPIGGRYSPEISLLEGFAMTVSGTPAYADHPRIIYPGQGWYGVPAAAVAGDPEGLLVGGKLVRGGMLMGGRLVR